MSTPPAAWKCRVCGYVEYNDEPPDFCIVCGAAREFFDPFVRSAFLSSRFQGASPSQWRCDRCRFVTPPGSVVPQSCPGCGAMRQHFSPWKP